MPQRPPGTVTVDVFDSVAPESLAARTVYATGTSVGGFASSKLCVVGGSDDDSAMPLRSTTYDVTPNEALHVIVTFGPLVVHDAVVPILNGPGGVPQMSAATLMAMAFESLVPPLFLARTAYVYEPPAATLKSLAAVLVVV